MTLKWNDRQERRITWALLSSLVLMLSVVMVPVLTEETNNNKLKCDLLGDEEEESNRERELLQKLTPLTSLSFSTDVQEGQKKYTYKFKVCGAAGNDTNGGLVQTEVDKETVIGRFNETHIYNGTDWIMLVYKQGDKYNNHCSKEERTAMVMISCLTGTLGKNFHFIGEERGKEKNCFYLFEMDSSIACPKVDSHLSLGSILLIVFFSLVAVYIIVGFLYQRLVVGAKGMEQYPNYSFWKDLGNLTADGCDFVCRSKPRNEPAAYRGIGDDQLGEETEERDDHLLPM
ncbi:cation-dependent mannose-6-phosphate receptor [Protopterus annectens]|uniref:cation-dependent mannose-6-phosphate receptor n=1 Tax=Protopterus annectens TaxID=7888 RepID=UPI001CFC4483|nr:cation-dependent mannose-6-phosphate receptor [Protopterus annectens]XP_043935598.1 cation-dependent mannose-6-phosphate receptor [Protopterus annectens]